MGLINYIAKRLVNVAVKNGSALDKYFLSQIVSPAIYPDNDDSTFIDSYSDNIDIFTVINKIVEAASTLPILQYDQKGNEVERGGMLDLINNPGRGRIREDLIEEAMTTYLIFGNSYTTYEAATSSLNRGKPIMLDILPPQWIEIVLGSYQQPVKGYRFIFSKEERLEYESERVLHWREYNPVYDNNKFGHLKGMSRLQPLLKTIIGSDSGYDSLVATFQHQGAVGLLSILGEDGKAKSMKQQSLSQLKAQYKREYTGAKKAGSIVITDKDHKWTNFGLKPVEMEVLKSLNIFRGRVYDAYNVPEILASGSEGRTYSNYKEAMAALWTNAIIPIVDSYLQRLSQFLGPRMGEEGHQLRADYSGIQVLQKDMQQLIGWMVAARSFTKNEIRAAAGYEADANPLMDLVYDSLGSVPISELTQMPLQEETEDVLKALKIKDYRGNTN